MIALDAILLLDGLRNPDISSYILHIMAYDPDPRIRYHVASCLTEFLHLKMLNKDCIPQRNFEDLYSFVDPPYMASEELAKSIWSLLM